MFDAVTSHRLSARQMERWFGKTFQSSTTHARKLLCRHIRSHLTGCSYKCNTLCRFRAASQLRDLLKDFPGSEYRAQWHATEILQRNFRSASARWKVARAICNAWIKTYDEHAGRYVFTHSSTGDTQYHKPWGMGLSDLWALPGDKVNETLLSLFLRVGVEVGVSIEGAIESYVRTLLPLYPYLQLLQSLKITLSHDS